MTKFADDTYLLVGSRSVGTVTDEFHNIRNWAAANNISSYPSKTKVLVVYRGRNRRFPELASPLIAWGRKGLLPQGPRSSPQLQAYNDRAHHCHSEHLFLLNVRVAPPTISRIPTTGATPGRQSNYSSLDPLRCAGVVGIRWRGGPSSPGAPSRQDASKWIPATRFPDLATLVEDADTKLFNSIRHNSTHVLRHYLIDKPVPALQLLVPS